MKKINFLATDGIILNGLIYESKEKTKDIILAVHGMASNCYKQRDQIIVEKANELGIDYFCFNNRGSELVKYIKRKIKDIVYTYNELKEEESEDILEYIKGIILLAFWVRIYYELPIQLIV